MRFDRKLYLVAMVIFAVLLFTTEVFADMGTVASPGEGGSFIPTVVVDQDDPEFGKIGFIITPTEDWRVQVDDILLQEGGNINNQVKATEYCVSGKSNKIDCTITPVENSNEIKFLHDPDLNADWTIIAGFIQTFTISTNITSEGSCGLITGPDGDSLPSTPPGTPLDHTVDEGSNHTFYITPTPVEFCQVTDVLVDGISYGRVTSYTFVNATSNHSIEATFEPLPLSAEFAATTASANEEITTGDQVTFTVDFVLGDLTHWKWYINNAIISEDQTPLVPPLVHTFTQTGDYTVALEVGNDVDTSTYYATYIVTISAASSPVALGSTEEPQPYESFSAAYNAIPEESEEAILMKASMPIEGEIVFNRNVFVRLKGGHGDGFEAPTNGFSWINGNVTILDGTVEMSNVIISSL